MTYDYKPIINNKITMKLTEDETIHLLINHLENSKWHIGEKYCLGQKHGIDIEACKDEKILMIEVKGARASDTAKNKKREFFDSGQIKTHFGKALVKTLQDKVLYPNSLFAIAHPDDEDIKKAVGHIIPFLKDLGIKHYWVSENKITEV
jgi:hypothetical protein